MTTVPRQVILPLLFPDVREFRVTARGCAAQPVAGMLKHLEKIPMHAIRFLACVVVCAALAASAQQPAIPSTPAGRTLQAWLDAFNSGDRAKIESYVRTVDPSQNADAMIGFRGHTGGFDLLSIDSSEPLQIRFRVVADYFMVGVSFATAINPVTKTSWEGTGVEPDVKVSADDALTTAEKLAADKIHAIRTADHALPAQ